MSREEVKSSKIRQISLFQGQHLVNLNIDLEKLMSVRSA